jgi:hypothetical protein
MKYLFVLFFLLSYSIYSQNEKKQLEIKRINNPVKIDGILNEDIWKDAPEAKDFVMFRPGSGNPEPENKKTIVKMLYDDEALYIGAYMYDDNTESIPMQFSTRDNFAQADFFGVIINPFNDGVNDLEFFVMSTGSQGDAKVTSNGEDFGWSAVWESETKLNEDGWCVEMKIPFSALRFSNGDIQDWGINFHRLIQSSKEQYSWNYIDKSKGRITEYSGVLKGLKNINPPIRLSFYPYAQGSYTFYNGKSEWNGTGGMDIKYGINESFTLDATLIPDFGQTAFDDVVLNLGPFEQEYKEQRAFFTEGTELFAKGNLFYSRRIGDQPLLYGNVENNLQENEIIIENPEKAKLLNAIKITGRTEKGLGIGFFNAFTNVSKATIKNTLSGEIRKFVTSPLTNYNAIVLDQQFKNTSSITLVNSNVWRDGTYHTSNVTSFLTDLRLLKNKYGLYTDMSTSQRFENHDDQVGFQGEIYFRKISGAHRWGVGSEISDKKYDKNDFGIQHFNNYQEFSTFYSYRIFEPKGNLNSINISARAEAYKMLKPSVYLGNEIEIEGNMTTKKELSFGFNTEFTIGTQKDYYEPRVQGRYFINHPVNKVAAWISTDYRKKLAVDAVLAYGTALGIEDPVRGPFMRISPRYRFNDRLFMVYRLEMDVTKSNLGFVKVLNDNSIIFGKRDFNSVTNTLEANYNFSTKSAIGLSLRQYWAPVKYHNQFYKLTDDGQLEENSYTSNHNINFNTWNLDLNYNWEFAPGSQMILLYRNSLFKVDDQSHLGFGENIDNLFNEPIAHQFSLRIVYYLDYNKLKS